MLALLNHPWLLDDHMELVAAIPLRSRALEQLRDGFLHVHAQLSPLDSEGLRTQLSKAGLGGIVARVENAITHRSDRFIRPEATRQDVETGWRQSLALHRKSLELERELEAAERAFQAEGTDEAFDRICDIRRQLLNTEGTEASAEDGGSASERAVGSI
jgi:DNA primase